jgi:hypothetical protein
MWTAPTASRSFGDDRFASKHSTFGVFGLALPSEDGGEAARVSGELVKEDVPEKAKENAEDSEPVGEGVRGRPTSTVL